MIKYLLLLILAPALIFPSLVQAYDVLVLQSRQDPAYEEALKGFRAAFRHTERVVTLSDYAEIDVVRIVREDRPGLVLALGDNALRAGKKLHQIPVIALMSLGVTSSRISQSNLTGIGMYIQPESYMAVFQKMKKRRVGVIYNPAKSGWYLQQARLAAQQADVELVMREVQSPKETLGKLAGLAGRVEALWMLPDTIAVTRETAEAYFRCSHEQRIPLVSFAGAYLGLGAAAVLEIKHIDLGRQAGKMAAKMLDGGDLAAGEISYPENVAVKTNPSVLRELGIASAQIEIDVIPVKDSP